MARPMLYHRSPAFTECLREVQDGLRWLLQTKQLPMLLAGSGTVGHGRRGLQLPAHGRQGDRHPRRQVRRALGQDLPGLRHRVRLHRRRVGQGRRPEGGRRRRWTRTRACAPSTRRPRETSTATKHDVAEHRQGGARRSDDIIICVDAITAIGVYDVPVDEWGLDVVVVGSQKALMLPPGLAVVSRLGQGLEGERAREPAALLPGPAARAEEPGEGRDRVHAGRVAGRRAARVAAHAEGRDAGGRVSSGTSAWPRRRAPRRAGWGWSCSRRRRSNSVTGFRDAERHRRHGGHQADAHALRHHDRGRPGSPEGEDRPHRAHRLHQRVRHHHRDLGAGDDALRSRASASGRASGVAAAQATFAGTRAERRQSHRREKSEPWPSRFES